MDTSIQRSLTTGPLDSGEDGVIATISRVYPTDQKDLWDACTTPDRLARWFLPVTGELRVGGRYHLEGNADGTVEACEAPDSFRATWEFTGMVSWIEVRISAVDAEHARFELAHIAPMPDRELWLQFGPGATGVGWDLALHGLAQHVADPAAVLDPAAAQEWSLSAEGVAHLTAASDAWAAANVAAGLATAEEARAAAAATTAFYTTAPES